MKSSLYSSLLLLILVSLCLPGCAGKAGKLMDSAQANYQVNDYESALRDAVMALKQKPTYERAQNFVTTYFKAAVDARKNKLKSLETSPDKFKWDSIVAEYKGLVEINTLVSNLPPLIHKKTQQRITFNTQDYTRELNEANENAAEVHYQEGIRVAATSDDVETQKRAAKEFRKVEEYVRGYKDVVSRYAQARSAGVKRMAILTFEDKSGKAHKYGALSDTITDEIIGAVLKDASATEFLEIVSRDQLNKIMAEQNLGFTGRFDEKTVAGIGEVAGVHELVIGQITNIFYTEPNPESSTYNRKRTVKRQTGTERYVDKNGKTKTRPKYSDVPISARVTHYQVASDATIVGSYKILDVKTAAIKDVKNFDVKQEFEAQWATFSGDQDALHSVDITLHNKGKKDPPTEEQMVFDAAKKLASELAEGLKAYAR